MIPGSVGGGGRKSLVVICKRSIAQARVASEHNHAIAAMRPSRRVPPAEKRRKSIWLAVQIRRGSIRLMRDIWVYCRALWKHWASALTGGSFAAVLTIVAVTGGTITKSVGVAFVVGMLVVASYGAWKHERSRAIRELSDRDIRLAELQAVAPQLTILDVSSPPSRPDSFQIYVRIVNPGATTTLNDDWTLEVTKADGVRIHGIHGRPTGPVHISGGMPTHEMIFFPYGADIPDWNVLIGARFLLTATDIRTHVLRDAYVG